ncbi:MAG: metalloregulator ArsR/SmtB family transcription factor [Chloroflexota bacterium]|nr:metalloregulator ArsR/SmtB family transcription factor [Chloroflexota bacterium]
MRSSDSQVQLLQALADPTRLEIVRQLARSDVVCACDFTDCCGVSQPTVSHHLKVLREAGVVTGERRGNQIYYALSPDLPDRFASIGASLQGLVSLGAAPAGV